ncbi:protein of unknown function [Ralstonia solanacearum CFBP2957]|nr:protein of unknown function [Ralstonia solanacearum CFBP2957]
MHYLREAVRVMGQQLAQFLLKFSRSFSGASSHVGRPC